MNDNDTDGFPPPTPAASSVLATLRSLIPESTLTLAETLQLIDAQAAALRALAGASDTPCFPESFVTDIPSLRLDETSLPLHGYSFWDPSQSRWVICRRSADTTAERRFTLLHEFAHILWHSHEAELFPGLSEPTRKRLAEHAADMFAREVLMPRRLVKSAYCDGVRSSAQLAAHFNVSAKAARSKLAQMDLGGPFPRPFTTPLPTRTEPRIEPLLEAA